MNKLAQEQQAFDAEIKQVTDWFSSPRFANVKRPYTPQDGTVFLMLNVAVVSKRGTLPITYPSHTQALKLWALLKSHQAQQTASFTYGALDPVQVIQMGKYLDTIYISGWQSSSTASTSNEPGPDLADYPMVIFLNSYD